MLDVVIQHLSALVAIDTQNPPRHIDTDGTLVAYVRGVLEPVGFDVRVEDLGEGCVNILCVRAGGGRTLINCHLDTVPADAAWAGEGDPLTLRIVGSGDDARATGLGTADVKGAAACLLTAAQTTRGPASVLFTSDEEAGDSRCVRAFVSRGVGAYARAVVCEPTMSRAVLAHRGILSFQGDFAGRAMHASDPRAGGVSALHHAIAWAHAAIDLARAHDWRLNIGTLTGGAKPNVSASSASLRAGLRPPPGHDAGSILRRLEALAPEGASARWQTRFVAPALTRDESLARWLAHSDIPLARDVDFWTEAALFAHAGLPACVLGPGDIAQAHTAGESVRLDQLNAATARYQRIMQT